MDKSFAEPALSVMYLLTESRIPLNLEQISEGLEYAGGWTYLDSAIGTNEMLECGFIEKQQKELGDFYTITISGRIELARLTYFIPNSIRVKISDFIKENTQRLSLNSHITSSIVEKSSDKYQLWLRAYDKDMELSDIVLTFPDIETAKRARENWDDHAGDIIATLLYQLLK